MTTQASENKPVRQLQVTADGSHTLFIPSMDEHYHSVNGAVQESRHVFIGAGWQECRRKEIRILEIGFGTGLNAFLTFLEAEKEQRHVTYYSVERYPLDEETVRALNYPEVISPGQAELFYAMHRAPWEEDVSLTPFFTLHKIGGDSNTCPLPSSIDLIYFDAFAPDKQPEMWNQAIFDKLYALTSPEGILTTYCAKGVVRRMMQAAGYQVERIPGPPGKREMLRARKETSPSKDKEEEKPMKTFSNLFLREAAELLSKGSQVKLRVGGNSMLPFLHDGKEVIELTPFRDEELVKGTVAFFRSNQQGNDHYIIHRLIGRTPEGRYVFQGDGNLQGREVVAREDIFGMLRCIYLPGGKVRHCNTLRWKASSLLWYLCRPIHRYLLAILRRISTN